MAGLDYEDGAEMSGEYGSTLKNIASGYYHYLTQYDEEYVVTKALDAGAYYLVLPTGDGYKVMLLKDYAGK